MKNRQADHIEALVTLHEDDEPRLDSKVVVEQIRNLTTLDEPEQLSQAQYLMRVRDHDKE